MSVTITLHLWWLFVYLAVGVVFWLPMERLAHRQTTRARDPFWSSLRRSIDGRPLRVLLPIVAWPAALWELFQ